VLLILLANLIFISNLIFIADKDQLHAQRSGSSVVTGHGQEDAVSQFGVGAWRQADGRITVTKRGLEGSAKLGRMEQAANVSFGELEIGHEMKRRAD
jgi:hypothetical protein